MKGDWGQLRLSKYVGLLCLRAHELGFNLLSIPSDILLFNHLKFKIKPNKSRSQITD